MSTWREVQKFSWSRKEAAPRDFKLRSINNVKCLLSITVGTLKSCRVWITRSPRRAWVFGNTRCFAEVQNLRLLVKLHIFLWKACASPSVHHLLLSSSQSTEYSLQSTAAAGLCYSPCLPCLTLDRTLKGAFHLHQGNATENVCCFSREANSNILAWKHTFRYFFFCLSAWLFWWGFVLHVD